MQIMLTIPDEIYEEVAAIADRENRSVQDLLNESIHHIFRRFPRSKNYAQMAKEKEAYKKLHPELWEKYPHQYVAVMGGEVVDHDEDIMQLYERFEGKYPDTLVLLEKVLSVPERVFRFRSLRLIRDNLNLYS